MNAPVLQDFSYDPFDPAVMADPLPYYRTLRDEHPVYYVTKWDTYALSRFADIWDVLDMNDGTFVAVGGHAARRYGSGAAQRWAGARSAAAPVAVPRQLRLPDLRRCPTLHVGSVPAEPVSKLADRIRVLANERLDELLPRGAFDLTQDYGGIVAASIVCELRRPARRTCPRGTRHRQRGQPGAAGQRRRGRQRAAWLPRVSHPDRPAPPRRQSRWRTCRSSTT